MRKKEQAKGEQRGERSKGRGEMDVGERREWERMEKHRKDRKIGNSDFIDSVGDKFVTNSYIRTVQINWSLWEGRMDGVGF